MRDNKILVHEDKFNEMYDAMLWRQAFKSAGVDEWEGYLVAMDMYQQLLEIDADGN